MKDFYFLFFCRHMGVIMVLVFFIIIIRGGGERERKKERCGLFSFFFCMLS